jgi:exopolysaccharide biosynthesis predicted pyruvyltransferase EpsI
MKIGILTYWNSYDNYGQLLQCFALQHYLKELNHDAYLIRYIPPFSTKATLLKAPNKENLINKIIKRFIAHYKYKRNRRIAKENNFDEFRDQFIKQSSNIYFSIQELKDNPPLADIYIAGSDQIWSFIPDYHNAAPWFLDFGDKKTKRIAYAASFGKTQLEDNEKIVLRQLLPLLNHISLREKGCANFCHEITGKEIHTVLDPTLLLEKDKYINIFNLTIKPSKTNQQYIFSYFLNIEKEEDIYWKEISNYIERKRLKLILSMSNGYIPALKKLGNYKPKTMTIIEWLNKIYNSQGVITSSFHGLVFSIILERPFMVMLLPNKYKAGNERLLNLLNALDLTNHIYIPNSTTVESILNSPINWINIKEKLNKLKDNSISFLKDSLNA